MVSHYTENPKEEVVREAERAQVGERRAVVMKEYSTKCNPLITELGLLTRSARHSDGELVAGPAAS